MQLHLKYLSGSKMKLFRFIVISIIICGLVVLGITSLLPNKVIVSRARELTISDSVFNYYVKDVAHWSDWMEDLKQLKKKNDTVFVIGTQTIQLVACAHPLPSDDVHAGVAAAQRRVYLGHFFCHRCESVPVGDWARGETAARHRPRRGLGGGAAGLDAGVVAPVRGGLRRRHTGANADRRRAITGGGHRQSHSTLDRGESAAGADRAVAGLAVRPAGRRAAGAGVGARFFS